MVQLNPSEPGSDYEADLFFRVADALGYDLEAIENREEDVGRDCPCCQIDHVMELLLEHGQNCYRKGWHHVIDGTTPSCPDLLIDQSKIESRHLKPAIGLDSSTGKPIKP